MGICLSALGKSESPNNTGVNSKYVRTDENDLSNTNVPSTMMPPTPTSEGEILHCSNLKSFSLSELKAATRNFHRNNLLGEGDFGSVFKGWIDESSLVAAKPGTGVVIAVKILNQDVLEGHREWLAEMNYLAQFSHSHLVRLIGYCLKDKHRLLVYEYMPRGSLENHLFRHFQPLSWSLRLKVALDVAKGLAFLHNAETKMVCLDFRTSSILLDSVCELAVYHTSMTQFVLNYNAKLSVSGLAKDGFRYDKINANAARNFGHRCRNRVPEFFETGHLTAWGNVYSFGVVLLEMLSGKRAFDNNRPTGQCDLVEWAKPYLANKCEVLQVLDTHLEGQYSVEDAYKLATLTLQCLSTSPKSRPNMDEVVALLEQLQAPPIC